jgi:hypothetical protein
VFNLTASNAFNAHESWVKPAMLAQPCLHEQPCVQGQGASACSVRVLLLDLLQVTLYRHMMVMSLISTVTVVHHTTISTTCPSTAHQLLNTDCEASKIPARLLLGPLFWKRQMLRLTHTTAPPLLHCWCLVYKNTRRLHTFRNNATHQIKQRTHTCVPPAGL